MHPYKEYRIKVDKTVFESTRLGRPQTPGFMYTVFAESDTNHEKLASIKNKTMYDALDEGLSTLLMLLAVRNEQAVIRVGIYGLPFTEGGKQMLMDKYGGESQFLNFHFE